MRSGLYYISAVAGFIMIAGGMWLIYKEKLILDATTGKEPAVKVDIPFFGKLTTNIPALGLFILGFIPLFYPIYKSTTEYTRIEQDIKSEKYPVYVYAVIRQKSVNAQGKLVITIPNVESGDYEPEIIYIADRFLTDQEDISLAKSTRGVIELKAKSLQFANASPSVKVKPDIQAPDGRF